MSMGTPFSELIKQGFENFRAGINNLSQGTASIAQGANNGIQPFQGQSASGFLNTQPINGNGISGIADAINDMKQNGVFKTPENPQLNNNILGREIQQQTKPTFTPNFGGNSSSLGQAITNQAPSLFERLKGF